MSFKSLKRYVNIRWRRICIAINDLTFLTQISLINIFSEIRCIIFAVMINWHNLMTGLNVKKYMINRSVNNDNLK